MWYSGIYLIYSVFSMIIVILTPAIIETATSSIATIVVSTIMTLSVLIYIWWEIIDSLKPEKKNELKNQGNFENRQSGQQFYIHWPNTPAFRLGIQASLWPRLPAGEPRRVPSPPLAGLLRGQVHAMVNIIYKPKARPYYLLALTLGCRCRHFV